MSKIIPSARAISSGTKTPPKPLLFEEWGKGSIFDWYNALTDPSAKHIEKIQIWKDVSGPVPHRFIVLHMRNNEKHRFDRRPSHDPTAHLNVGQPSVNVENTSTPSRILRPDFELPFTREYLSLGAPLLGEMRGETPARKSEEDTRRAAPYSTLNLISNQAVISEDSYVLGINLGEIKKVAQCEIEITLRSQVDILTVISTCYAIHKDEETCNYSLFRFNCFFFSWTILMVVSRRNQPYEVPSPEAVIERFYSTVDETTEFLVDEAVALFLDLVVDTLAIIRDKAGTSLNPGMSAGGRMVWRMPIGVLRFFWRRLFNARLYCGLRKQLTEMVKKQIMDISFKVQEAALSNHVARDELNEHLWIEDIGPLVKDALRIETMKILWKAIIEAITEGLGSLGPEEIVKQLQDPSFTFLLLGKNVRQFCAVCSAASHGGLQAAKTISEGLEGLEHGDSFDIAWNAASVGALQNARIVARETSRILKSKSERKEMYEAIWGIWDDCWKEARERARPGSIRTVEAVVEKLMASGAHAMIQELKHNPTNAGASIPPSKSSKFKWSRAPPNQSEEMTTARLQESMYEVIKKDTINTDASEAVRTSMSRIWIAACKIYAAQPIVPELPAILNMQNEQTTTLGILD